MKQPYDYRLRQVALVTTDLERDVGHFREIFGILIAHVDLTMAKYGLRNAILAAGGDFIEVVGLVTEESSAARYLRKRGGDCGYMLIMQSEDAVAHRKRLAEKGILGIEFLGGEPYGAVSPPADPEIAAELERFSKRHILTHFHPRHSAGVLCEIDSLPGVENWREQNSAWPAAGEDWRRAASDFCRGICGATVEHPEPEAAAADISTLLDLPVVTVDDGPAVRLLGGPIRFVPALAGRGGGIVGLDMRVVDPDVARARAEAVGVLDAEGRIHIGGLAITTRPVDACPPSILLAPQRRSEDMPWTTSSISRARSR
jgi:hypothetical protein